MRIFYYSIEAYSHRSCVFVCVWARWTQNIITSHKTRITRYLVSMWLSFWNFSKKVISCNEWNLIKAKRILSSIDGEWLQHKNCVPFLLLEVEMRVGIPTKTVFCFSISSIGTSFNNRQFIRDNLLNSMKEMHIQVRTSTSLIPAQMELIGNEKWVHAVNAINLLSEMYVCVCVHVCQMQRRNWGSSSTRIYLLVSLRGTCSRFDFFLFR